MFYNAIHNPNSKVIVKHNLTALHLVLLALFLVIFSNLFCSFDIVKCQTMRTIKLLTVKGIQC